jgi:hypothetical protein
MYNYLLGWNRSSSCLDAYTYSFPRGTIFFIPITSTVQNELFLCHSFFFFVEKKRFCLGHRNLHLAKIRLLRFSYFVPFTWMFTEFIFTWTANNMPSRRRHPVLVVYYRQIDIAFSVRYLLVLPSWPHSCFTKIFVFLGTSKLYNPKLLFVALQ